MKRAEQLIKLSREHHASLVTAKKIAQIAEEGDDAAVLEAMENVITYFDDELDLHFQHEERTIFAPIFKKYQEHIPIAKVLLKEHGFIRMLVLHLTPENARESLSSFAEVLNMHTHMEERELFPIVEKAFTDEELDAILNFEPIN